MGVFDANDDTNTGSSTNEIVLNGGELLTQPNAGDVSGMRTGGDGGVQNMTISGETRPPFQPGQVTTALNDAGSADPEARTLAFATLRDSFLFHPVATHEHISTQADEHAQAAQVAIANNQFDAARLHIDHHSKLIGGYQNYISNRLGAVTET